MRSARVYWTCQAIGWASFTLYVLTGYVASIGWARLRPADIVSIVFFDFFLCIAVSHGLRHWMKRRGWLALPARRLAPRLVASAILIGATLTGLVLGQVALEHRPLFARDAIIGMFIAFSVAMAGWLVIYFQVLARRGRQTLERRALELSIVARDAQLRALRSQLNPHFLFNSLNSLRGLITEDPARAASMVTGFAGLMRYSLGSDRRETVTLAEEMEAVGDYLDLERVRFEDRLRVEQTVTPDALTARIPPMMVQTRVENGIANLRDGGLVGIDASVTDSRLRIRVTNTGTLSPGAGTTGVGLENVRERLRLLYGATASLSLDGHDGTVTAMIVVPCAEASA